MERFYCALDAIVAMKKIRGVNTYCRLYEIDRRNLISNRLTSSLFPDFVTQKCPFCN